MVGKGEQETREKMSKGSTPVHHFDGFYDPEYTAEISTKMQVPDRIMVVQDGQQPARPVFPIQPEKLVMNVPDRILLGGGENSTSITESRLENKNISRPTHPNNPPHTITMDSHNFIDDEEPHQKKYESGGKSIQIPHNGYVVDLRDYEYNKSYPFTPSTPPGMTSFTNGDDELSLMRRQVKTLTRRVMNIEEDNQQRQQREIVLYSAGFLYFLLKGLLWLHRHW